MSREDQVDKAVQKAVRKLSLGKSFLRYCLREGGVTANFHKAVLMAWDRLH